MMTCENCGCRVYSLGCVNCNEEAYIVEQETLPYGDDDLPAPSGDSDA